MAIPWRSWLTALLVLSGAVLAARAQAPVEPAHDPQLNDPSVDEKLNEQRHGERKAAPVPPSAQAPGHTPRAGASSVLPRPPEGRFLPEGTFLSSRAGVVAASKGGRLVFVPAEKEGATSSESAPLALLPNQRLAQLEATLGGSTEPRLATLSGQVFVYRERSYLLVSVFSLGGDRARNDAAAAGNEPRAPGPEDRADAQALMRELDERSAGPRAMDRGGPGSTIGEERRPRRPARRGDRPGVAPGPPRARARRPGPELRQRDGKREPRADALAALRAHRATRGPGRLARRGRAGQGQRAVDRVRRTELPAAHRVPGRARGRGPIAAVASMARGAPSTRAQHYNTALFGYPHAPRGVPSRCGQVWEGALSNQHPPS